VRWCSNNNLWLGLFFFCLYYVHSLYITYIVLCVLLRREEKNKRKKMTCVCVCVCVVHNWWSSTLWGPLGGGGPGTPEGTLSSELERSVGAALLEKFEVRWFVFSLAHTRGGSDKCRATVNPRNDLSSLHEASYWLLENLIFWRVNDP